MQHDFILLDRSGSMSSQWVEAVSAVNGYVKKLADDNVDTGVTLMAFDKNEAFPCFDVVRDRIIPTTWRDIDVNETPPRGMTPLNDAIGQIVSLANKGINGAQYDKVAVIIMTDGLENASQEFDHASAKAMLDGCRNKGWQIIFLGANFDNAAQAASYGNVAAQTAMASSANLGAAMQATAAKRRSYAAVGAPMSYSDAEKAAFKR